MSSDTRIIIAVIRVVGYVLLMTLLDGRARGGKRAAAESYNYNVDEAIREAGGQP